MDGGEDDHFETCVVLGGRGFVGRHLVLRFLKLGNWIVRVADSADSLQLDDDDSVLAHAISTGRASYFRVDVCDKATLVRAIAGSSVVFYIDDVDSCRKDFYLCYTIIVQGAKNVINACRECKVKRLIYNSTADVVNDSSHHISNGDECFLYASKFEDPYTDLKAQAEALVVFSSNIDGLLTCALRPCNVFGPGDKQLVPFIIDIARSCWGKFIVSGNGSASDFTYVENVAHALICAEEALGSQTIFVSGKAFFITNHQPMKYCEFVSPILEGLGYQRSMVQVPATLVQFFIMLVKLVHSKMNSGELGYGNSFRNVAQLPLHSRRFNCSAAQQHIGYTPVVSMEEGIALTIESFSHLADFSHSKFADFDEGSKVQKLLGGGEVAEILLWRDEKKSFTYFLALFLLYCWFFLCGRTFISSAAKLLLLITVILSAYGLLSSNTRFDNSIPKIPATFFEVTEVSMKSSATTAVNILKRVGHITRSLAQGEDWNLFFKVVVSLYILKLIVANYLTSSIGVALALSSTAFFVYEQYEEQIDVVVKVLSNSIRTAMEMLLKSLPIEMDSLLKGEVATGTPIVKDRK